jgi:carbon monoxide dehydrogenase subunit G
MELTNDFRVSAAPPVAWKVLTDVERIAPMLPGAQLQEIEGDDFRGVVKVKVGPITAQYKGTASFAEQDESAGRVVLKATGRDTRGQGNASATITATLQPDGEGTRVSVVTDLTVTGKVAQFGRGVLADVSAKLIGQFVDALEADLRSGPSTDAATPDAATPDATTTTTTTDAAAAATDAGTTDAAAPDAPAPTDAPAPAPTDSAGAAGSDAMDPAPAGSATSAGSSAGPADEVVSRVRKIDSPEPEPVDLLDAAGGSVAKRLVPVLGVVGVLILLLLIGRSRRQG